MRSASLVAQVERVLGPILVELGYRRANRHFCLELDSKVVHLIFLDLAPGGNSFRLMLGVDSTVIDGQPAEMLKGAYLVRFLTRKGIIPSGEHWPCPTKEITVRSLERLKILAENLLPGWISEYKSLETLADTLDDRHLYEKGVLLLKGERREEGRRFLEMYREQLRSMRPSADVDKAVDMVAELLEKS